MWPERLIRGEAHQPESHLMPRLMNVAVGREKEIQLFGTDYPTAHGTACETISM
jgi:UDP-glucose 4-epimerase